MESFGFTFFQAFADFIANWWWLLGAICIAFIVKQITGFRPEERLMALLMFLYFFLVITSFWILKPIKKGVFISYIAESGFDWWGWQLQPSGAEQVAKVMNMVVAFAAAAAFAFLARSLRRQQLTYIFCGFFIVAYVLYGFVLDSPGGATAWSFYLFGDLFSTLMVVTFFAFLNDSVTPDIAKRLYGLIGLGGVVGGFFGSSVVAVNVKSSMNPSVWLWVCLGIAVLIALIAMMAGRLVQRNPPPEAVPTDQEQAKPQGSSALEGARLVFRSPYLLSIMAIVGLYEMVSTIMDFQFTDTVFHYLGDDHYRHSPRVYSFTNGVALVVQLLLTSFVMVRFGVGVALLFLPIAACLGSAGFLIVPGLLLGSFLNTTDNGFSYSINQSAKEVLYVPTTRDEKYKAKAFIDMFIQRFAKAVAVGINLVIATWFAGFENVRWLSLATVAILLLWIVAARYAGRVFAEKERAAAAPA